jgi:hypothetical protein
MQICWEILVMKKRREFKKRKTLQLLILQDGRFRPRRTTIKTKYSRKRKHKDHDGQCD